MSRQSNYDKFPFVSVGPAEECSTGWDAIAARISAQSGARRAICLESYPGALTGHAIDGLLDCLPPATVFYVDDCLKTPEQLRTMLDPLLGTDRVFGRMSSIALLDYFDAARLAKARISVEQAAQRGPIIVAGTGASLISPRGATLVYADLARWEIQLRWRRGEIGNFGLNNAQEDFAVKYKCGFFAEWRAADRLKKQLLSKIDFLLDTNQPQSPKLISGDEFRRALKETARRPFRVVPYFDPGPWGGHWMEKVCDLPRDVPNHAWCFDCVPEENSLLLGFGEQRVEVPAIDVVFAEPHALLGDGVHRTIRRGVSHPV